MNRRLTISRANCFWKLSKRWIKIDYPFLWKKCYQTSDLPIIQPISYSLGNSKYRDSSLFDQTEKDCFSATELMYVKAPVLNPCKRISLAIKTRLNGLRRVSSALLTPYTYKETHFKRIKYAFSLRLQRVQFKLNLTYPPSLYHSQSDPVCLRTDYNAFRPHSSLPFGL